MMDDLNTLAARAEAATGPDRELDGWIYAHMTRGERYLIGNEPGRFPQKPIYGERMDVMREYPSTDSADYINAPRYSASLDAALTLYIRVPERVPSDPRLAAAEALRQRAGEA